MQERFGANEGDFRELSLKIKREGAQFSLQVINLNGPPK